MNSERGRQGTYLAYMLRLWQAGSNSGRPVWRASLENPHTGERLAFGDAKDLLVFLGDIMADPGDTSAWQADNEPATIGVTDSSAFGED